MRPGCDMGCDTVSATERGAARKGRFCRDLLDISFGTARAYHYMTNEAAHSIDEGRPNET